MSKLSAFSTFPRNKRVVTSVSLTTFNLALVFLMFFLSATLSNCSYVPGFDNKCWSCLLNNATLNNQIYCPADNYCYNSVNDTCAATFAYNPQDCLKITSQKSSICSTLQFVASGSGAKKLLT
jgi:hypothetical protein